MFDSAYEVVEELVHPLQLMLLSASYLPGTLFSLLQSRQFTTVLSLSSLKYAWFARFWSAYGPLMKEGSGPRVAPLIGLASGVVIDVGPGSGEWIGLFNKEKVTKVFLPGWGIWTEKREFEIKYMLTDPRFMV
jgi:hypothetical protein